MTDTDALKERIGRILNDEGWTFEGIHEPGEYDRCEECRRAVDPIAVRVAREVAAEVRKAKAEALREAAENVDVGSLVDSWTRGAVTRLSVTNAVAEVLMSLRNRATEYEAMRMHPDSNSKETQ